MPVTERDDIGLERLRELYNLRKDTIWEQEVADDFIVFTFNDFTAVITNEETTELMETQAFSNMTSTVGGATSAESNGQTFLLRMNQRVGGEIGDGVVVAEQGAVKINSEQCEHDFFTGIFRIYVIIF